VRASFWYSKRGTAQGTGPYPSWPCALVIAVALAGCATPPVLKQEPAKAPPAPSVSTPPPAAVQPPQPPQPPPPPQPSAAEKELADAVELYDKGEYDATIAKLRSLTEGSAADPQIHVKALKYLAFSYCLTRRTTLCRRQFDAAFKLDPNFDLEPAERGHPLWGPTFERAKKAHQTAAK